MFPCQAQHSSGAPTACVTVQPAFCGAAVSAAQPLGRLECDSVQPRRPHHKKTGLRGNGHAPASIPAAAHEPDRAPQQRNSRRPCPRSGSATLTQAPLRASTFGRSVSQGIRAPARQQGPGPRGRARDMAPAGLTRSAATGVGTMYCYYIILLYCYALPFSVPARAGAVVKRGFGCVAGGAAPPPGAASVETVSGRRACWAWAEVRRGPARPGRWRFMCTSSHGEAALVSHRAGQVVFLVFLTSICRATGPNSAGLVVPGRPRWARP